MTAIVAGWENFFVAEVGAAAALSGLLFVAVSINLTRILAIQHLPARAAESLVILLSVLAVATFGLVPGQSRGALGAEVGGTGLLVWLLSVRTQLRAWLPTRVLATQAACIPFVVAGGLLLAGRDSALYWIVPGTVASFGAGVLNAWVLLVEIQR
jgi:modulator of FtsH protease